MTAVGPIVLPRTPPGCEADARPRPDQIGASLPPIYRPPPAHAPPLPDERARFVEALGYDLHEIRFPSTLGTAAPQLAVATSRRWRAIDVYAQIPRAFFAGAGAYMRVLIFGVNQYTGRSLVASGLYGGTPATGQTAAAARIVGALGPIPQQFEVHVALSGGIPTADDSWNVTAIATDEAAENDTDDGAAILAGAAALPGVLTTATILPGGAALPAWQLALASVHATNNAGAARWLQFHDQPDVLSCALARPVFSIGVGAVAGDHVEIGPENLRRYRFNQAGLVAFPSLTPNVGNLAGPNDIVFTVGAR